MPSPRRRLRRLAVPTALVLTLLPAAACAHADPVAGPRADAASSASKSPIAADPGPDEAKVSRVVAISMDGFNPRALARTGVQGTPVLHRFIRQGASTLNARTEVEMTITLPNHTSMVTGRRIEAAQGGHGVTWNDDRIVPATVQAAAGGPVDSVFSTLHAEGESTALFASKTKFSLWNRSWPQSLDQYTTRLDNAILARSAARDIKANDRAFTFVHFSAPDVAGHANGWMSKPYLDAVRATDKNVRTVLRAIKKSGAQAETLVIITADHGGVGPNHVDTSLFGNYRIPFLVRGPGVPKKTDLYSLNPAFKDPRKAQPAYAAKRQPVRNGMVANLTLDALGYAAVPGSELDAAQDLEVFAP